MFQDSNINVSHPRETHGHQHLRSTTSPRKTIQNSGLLHTTSPEKNFRFSKARKKHYCRRLLEKNGSYVRIFGALYLVNASRFFYGLRPSVCSAWILQPLSKGLNPLRKPIQLCSKISFSFPASLHFHHDDHR